MWVFVFWFYDEFRGGFGVLGGGFRWWWTMVVGCGGDAGDTRVGFCFC